MAWNNDLDHPFAGISEKLNRADQNIVNLNSEIITFFNSCEYPVIPKIGDQELLKFLNYHKTLEIPLRFSVLAGEVIHHFRSVMDHIVWIFSDDVTREDPKASRFLEFPILEHRPTRKNRPIVSSRKIKGIRKCHVIKLIFKLQPYRRIDPTDDPLLLIHKMDVADKHKELLIFNSTGYVEGLPPAVAAQFVRYLDGKDGRMTPDFISQFNYYGKPSLQVAFKDFSGREVKPVVPTLKQLLNWVNDAVGLFATEV